MENPNNLTGYDSELARLREIATRMAAILEEVMAAEADDDTCDASEAEILTAFVFARLGDAGLQALARINAGPELLAGTATDRYRSWRTQARRLAAEIEYSVDGETQPRGGLAMVRQAIREFDTLQTSRPARQLGPDVVAAAHCLIELIESAEASTAAEAPPSPTS